MNVKKIQIFVAHIQSVVTFLAPMTVHAKKDLHQGKANCNAKVWTKGNIVKGLLGQGILLTRVLRRSCLLNRFLFEEKSVTIRKDS